MLVLMNRAYRYIDNKIHTLSSRLSPLNIVVRDPAPYPLVRGNNLDASILSKYGTEVLL